SQVNTHAAIEAAFSIRTAEVGHQVMCRHKIGAETRLDGGFGQCHTKMCFADARRAQENDVAGLVDETQRAQLPDLPFVDGGLKAEVELIEFFHERQMRQLQPSSEIAAAPRIDLAAEHVLKE